jgi:hypothetical protein
MYLQGQGKNKIFDFHHGGVVGSKDLQPGVQGGRLKCRVGVKQHLKT